MFKKILVPVDGSETAWRALNNALEIGKKFESEILVVNVIQPYNNAALLAVPLDHATIKYKPKSAVNPSNNSAKYCFGVNRFVIRLIIFILVRDN